jgi:hypothetical protein
VHYYLARYFLSLGNVAFSLFLGVAALAATAIYYENFTRQLFRSAGQLREWILFQFSSPAMELIARFVLHESTIVLVAYVLAARIVVGAIITFLAWLFRRH